jgi:hypothetical protein
MEFSLPFLTSDLLSYTPSLNGRLLGYIGLIASILQGGVTRRLPPLLCVRLGVVSCLAAFIILSTTTSEAGLYGAATLLAVTTATVVTGLNALSSLEAGVGETGRKLGGLRGWGQLGRAAGPIAFCSLYWAEGRTVAYRTGATIVAGVVVVVFGLLNSPVKEGGDEKKVEGKKDL